MTAEPDLLPLPPKDGDLPRFIGLRNGSARTGCDPCWLQDSVEAYARTRVAHATAAKAAEIEALRAEVERLRRDRDDCLAAREYYASLYGEQHGSAERLAEALWTRAQTWENEGIRLNGGSDKPYSDDENSIRAFVLGCCSDDLKAILRDVIHHTAAQENDDA